MPSSQSENHALGLLDHAPSVVTSRGWRFKDWSSRCLGLRSLHVRRYPSACFRVNHSDRSARLLFPLHQCPLSRRVTYGVRFHLSVRFPLTPRCFPRAHCGSPATKARSRIIPPGESLPESLPNSQLPEERGTVPSGANGRTNAHITLYSAVCKYNPPTGRVFHDQHVL